MIVRFLFLTLFISLPVFAQNLMEERIWKVSPRKKSIFLDAGVFHHAGSVKNVSIKSVRSSSAPGRGYERLVIDFSTSSIPKTYGHISSGDKKISIDFFDTTVAMEPPQIKNSKSIKSIDFISVDGKSVTMELILKAKTSFDVFYLDNPGRLVLDIR